MNTHESTFSETLQAKLLDMKGNGPWTAEKSATVITAALQSIRDAKNKPLNLSDEEQKVVKNVFVPTVPGRVETIRYVLSQHGVALEPEAEAFVRQFLNPTKVQKDIDNAASRPKRTIADLITH